MAKLGPKQRRGLITAQTAENQKAIRDILLKARDKTQADIIRFAKKENFMRAAYLRDTLYKQLGEQYVAFQGELDEWVQSSTEETMREWRKLGIEDIKRGPRKYTQSWEQFSRKYLEETVARIHPLNAARLGAVNAHVGGMLAKDIEELRRNVVDVFRLGAATGMTNREMQKEMLNRTLDARPAWSFIDASGRTWKANNYFDMLGRTVAAEAARSSYQATINEAGYDLATIEGGITADSLKWPNDPCPRWAGKIVSTTGKTRGYPSYQQALDDGMFHPRCRHYLGAVLTDVPGELAKAKKEERALDQLGQKAQRQAKRMRVAAKEAGEKINPGKIAMAAKKAAREELGQAA